MSTVYQHQLHAHKPRKHHRVRWTIITLIVIGGVIGGLFSLKPDTKITKAKTVSHVLTGHAATQTFHEGYFAIDLPQGWKFIGEQKDIYDIFHFKSADTGDADNRLLDVYQDSTLPNFAMNRMIPVEATDDGGLNTDASEVSDNCTAYTTGTPNSQGDGLAKWQGIEFLCDMGNSLRNVVGIGSKDGLNTVIVKTQTSTAHHYFMTYTEDNDKPDYSVFATAINSFQVTQ